MLREFLGKCASNQKGECISLYVSAFRTKVPELIVLLKAHFHLRLLTCARDVDSYHHLLICPP